MCIRDASKAFVLLLLITATWLCAAQEFRQTTTVTSRNQSFEVDLTKVSGANAATISIRNSSANPVRMPQVSVPDKPWPYTIESVKRALPSDLSDHELAIATWKYVTDHSFHYCSAGTTLTDGLHFETDPVLLINSFGFGCCDQTDRVLVWIWKQLGYDTRLAVMYFHTVPEIYYDGSWHMLDPDHRSYYLREDGSIASIADILEDPEMIVRQSNDGLDGVGWSAETMARLYAENAPTLTYQYSGFLNDRELEVWLRPNERLTIHSENLASASHSHNSGDPFSFKNVGTGVFDWDLSFAGANWESRTSAATGVEVVEDETGRKYLTAMAGSTGSVTYKSSSIFPVLAISVLAQASTNSGRMAASFSRDGENWSTPVQLQRTTHASSYQLSANLSGFASGAYTYYVRIDVSPGAELEGLRLQSVVQLSKWLFPRLRAGAVNTLRYSDDSPEDQRRRLRITASVPTGEPSITGLQAVSRLPESPTYSLARGYGAPNLVDQNRDTVAYPGRREMDYQVDLNGLRRLKSVSIDWGYFGADERYITSWTLLGSVGSDTWVTLAGGAFPGTGTTTITLDAIATSLRLVANGQNNVGVFDLRVFGTEIPETPKSELLAASMANAQTVNPGGYPASNLVDGDSSTVAFPWARTIDYKVSLQRATSLSAAIITWGYFGQNPAYVRDWSLLGRNSITEPWKVLAGGASPNQASTGLLLDSEVTEVRLVANSTNQNIGVFELRLFGMNSDAKEVPLSVSSSSNQVEANHVTSYGTASQLVDGSYGTFSYPGSRAPDYTLDLQGETHVESVRVNWGYFGTSSRYIGNWRLLGVRTGSPTWELIASGGFPGSEATVIPVKNSYTQLRIAADSDNDHVGIFEVEVFGIPAKKRTEQMLETPRRGPKVLMQKSRR